MWRLTITQKKKSEFTKGYLSETLEFTHKEIFPLMTLIQDMVRFKGPDTKYELEMIGENEPEMEAE